MAGANKPGGDGFRQRISCVQPLCTLIDCQLLENPPMSSTTRSTHWCQQTDSEGDFFIVDKKLSLCRLHCMCCRWGFIFDLFCRGAERGCMYVCRIWQPSNLRHTESAPYACFVHTPRRALAIHGATTIFDT